MAKIKKDDTVICRSGRDKGKKGKVLSVAPKRNRAIVEGLNMIKRHTRKTREDQQGGIIKKEASIHVSNLMLFCNKCSKPVRVGFTTLKDNTKSRICKRCSEVIG
ncbi:50S ribosomal protein L24 [Candidatus Omnitrophota bacterium]